MSAFQLLVWILTALLLQLVLGVGWVVWQRRAGSAVVAGSGFPAGGLAPARPTAAWIGWRAFRVVRREPEDPAWSQCSFYLQPVDGQPLPAFRPGQFLTFSLDLPATSERAEAGGRTLVRCYSLSDRPEPDHYRVTIKRVGPPADAPGAEPGLSSNFFHDHVQVGDVLRVKAPAGHFFIEPDAAVPAVLIAGGIGITPLMSMLRWCLAEQPQRALHLYYGLRSGHDLAFGPLLQALAAAHPGLHLHVVYSRPAAQDLPPQAAPQVRQRVYWHRGHVDVDLLRGTLPHGPHQFYVCGPPAMMQTLVPALAAWGVAPQNLHFEAFGPASVSLPGLGAAAPAQDAQRFEVQFLLSGRTLVWDGRDASLLEFAERHGVAVDSGCRSGGCGTCETRLVQGSVHYEHPPDHDVAPGCCLPCVARPSSALVLQV